MNHLHQTLSEKGMGILALKVIFRELNKQLLVLTLVYFDLTKMKIMLHQSSDFVH